MQDSEDSDEMLRAGKIDNKIQGGNALAIRCTLMARLATKADMSLSLLIFFSIFFSSLLLFFFSTTRAAYAQATFSKDREQPSPTPNTQHPTPNSSLSPQSSTITVIGAGMAAFNGDVAAAQEEAIWDAKRNAVEQAVGLLLKAKTTGRNFGVEEEEIVARSEGFVRRWEVVEGSRRIETVTAVRSDGQNGGGKTAQVLHIEVRATVELVSLLHRLSDAADLYKDLERPRLRVQITSRKEYATVAARVQQEWANALGAQGFEVVAEGAAEVVLKGALEVVPTIRLGDKDAPYGIGDSVAACRVRLNMQAVSVVSEEVLSAPCVEVSGRSFQSNEDAVNDAATQLFQSTMEASEKSFVPALLARWVYERQEGYVVALRIEGLTGPECNRLKQMLTDMRGFRRFVDEQRAKRQTTLRFLTRRDTRSLRRDLAQFALSSESKPQKEAQNSRPSLLAFAGNTARTGSSAPVPTHLRVLNDRGPLILCAAHDPVSKH